MPHLTKYQILFILILTVVSKSFGQREEITINELVTRIEESKDSNIVFMDLHIFESEEEKIYLK